MTEAVPALYISPPVYASRLGVSPEKVLGWIKRGGLRAVDVSTNAGTGRPRWKISPEAIQEFESRRSTTQPVAKRQRRKRPVEVLDII